MSNFATNSKGILHAKLADGIKEADITTSGNKDRLAVDSFISNNSSNSIPVNITGGGGLSRYSPKFYTSSTPIACPSGSDTSLVTINETEGKVDFIEIRFSNNACEFILKVDTIEILRIKPADLKDTAKYGTDFATHTGPFALSAEGDRQLYISWLGTPADFNSSIELLGRGIGSSINMIGVIVMYRHKL